MGYKSIGLAGESTQRAPQFPPVIIHPRGLSVELLLSFEGRCVVLSSPAGVHRQQEQEDREAAPGADREGGHEAEAGSLQG